MTSKDKKLRQTKELFYNIFFMRHSSIACWNFPHFYRNFCVFNFIPFPLFSEEGFFKFLLHPRTFFKLHNALKDFRKFENIFKRFSPRIVLQQVFIINLKFRKAYQNTKLLDPSNHTHNVIRFFSMDYLRSLFSLPLKSKKLT